MMSGKDEVSGDDGAAADMVPVAIFILTSV